MTTLDEKTKYSTKIIFHLTEQPIYLDANRSPRREWHALFPDPRNEMGRDHMIAFLQTESYARLIAQSRPGSDYQKIPSWLVNPHSVVFFLDREMNPFSENTRDSGLYKESKGTWLSVIPERRGCELVEPLGFFQYDSDSKRVREAYSGLSSVRKIDVEVLLFSK